MSFSLHANLSFYPQFMFNLRRSPFVQVGGSGEWSDGLRSPADRARPPAAGGASRAPAGRAPARNAGAPTLWPRSTAQIPPPPPAPSRRCLALGPTRPRSCA
jgi:hypothetical protein